MPKNNFKIVALVSSIILMQVVLVGGLNLQTVGAKEITQVVSQPTLTTDKADYHPGETATIFGNLFQSLQNIVLKIFGGSFDDGTYTESTQTITADSSGSFITNYILDNIYRPFYTVVANTLDGTKLSQTMFRDSAIGTYDQCSNDLGAGYPTGDSGCRWINGNLQSNNSTYMEGDSTVQRLWIEGYEPGSTHTVTFQYGTTKAGKHAYDFLTTWNASENWITVADRCQGITGCTTASETTLAIPHDSNGSGQFESGTRNFTMRGGTISSATSPAIISGGYGGDSETAITITFTVNSSGAMCKTKQGVTSCGIAIWFGAHISKSMEWTLFNGTTGAGSISGSPYHVALSAEDGASIGQRDNQMQANAVISQSTITIHKVTSNGDTSTVFSYTATGIGYTGFNLTGGSQNQQIIAGTGSFSVTETLPSGWANTGLTCTASGTGAIATPNLGNHSVAITIGSNGGATIDCIYTNSLQQAHLTLIKTVTNDNGGKALATAWALAASGPTPISGTTASTAVTNAAVNSGTYALSENSGPAGYTQSIYSCVVNGGAPIVSNSLTLIAGDNATCTINNNDNPAHLIVIKHVINDNGGIKVASDFTTTISTVTTAIPTAAGAEAPGVNNTLTSVGSYSVDEGAHIGYDKTLSADCSGTIALGETKTCTITNNDIQPKLTLTKVVVNDNGGTKVVSDFPLFVNTTGVTSGVQNGFNAGSYIASETSQTGYMASAWSGDCAANGSITLLPGDVKACTITNNDIAPKLTLVKIVINNNGGTKVVSDFPLFINGSPVTSGVTNTLSANVLYTATETNQTGYSASSWTGDCSANGTITLSLGDNKTCTITNDDQPGTLIVHKITIPSSDTTTQFGITLNANPVTGNATQNITGGATVNYTVNAGSYSVNEAPLAGWSMTGNDCLNVLVANGETKNCTITNAKSAPAHLIVSKETSPIGRFKIFNITASGTGTITGGGAGTINAGTGYIKNQNYEVTPGTYSVAEDISIGWYQMSNTCVNVVVGAGETKTCTIVNKLIDPRLTLVKTVTNDNGGTALATDWTLSASALNPFEISGTTGSPEVTNADVEIGTYTLSESGGPAGYAAGTWSCVINGGAPVIGNSITLIDGDRVICTVNNNDIAPQLNVVKHVINDEGNVAVASDFTMQVSGNNVSSSSFPGSESGVTVNLNAGSYSINEGNHAGYTMTLSSDCQGSINIGQTKTCTITNNDNLPATRTLGFWQTHTTYTTGMFNSISGGLTIGEHIIDSPAKLFAGFYANISKTSTGEKRSALDQARMQMLQQWLAAELNCTLSGCSAVTQTLLSDAVTEWVGTNPSAILSYVSQLEAYNNSNEALPISGQGSATPKSSQLTALPSLAFWDSLP